MIGLARVVFRKELVDHLRDKRTLSMAFMLPILGPVLVFILLTMVAGWMAGDKVVHIGVVGMDRAPNLVTFLRRTGMEVTAADAQFKEQVKSGKLDVVVVVDATYPEKLEKGEPAHLELYVDNSRNAGRERTRRGRHVVEAYAGQIAATRLLVRGVSPDLARPIDVEEVDVATSQELAATLLNMIPLFLLMVAFTGAMHLAIDGTAGERERKSLEPLLVNPVGRGAIVMGKWLAASLVAFGYMVLSALGFAFTVARAPLADLGLRASLGAPEVAAILLAMAPLVLLASGLEILVALFAKTFKEAQLYLTLVIFVPMSPGFVLALHPIEASTKLMMVPGFSQALLISGTLRGEPLHISWLLLSAGVTIALAATLVSIAGRLLGSERIVFGR